VPDGLRPSIADLRRRFGVGELAGVSVVIEDQIVEDAQWFTQMLFDEMAEYQNTPKQERETEPGSRLGCGWLKSCGCSIGRWMPQASSAEWIHICRLRLAGSLRWLA
jgi:hypothetical protein